MSQRQALLTLLQQLAPEHPTLIKQIETACDDPVAYVKRYQRRLSERVISSPVSNLPQIALLDALDEKKRLVELDVNSAPEDVTFSVGKLESIPKKKGRFKPIEKLDDFDDLDAATVLELAGKALATEGIVLAALDIGSDSYPVIALSAIQVDAMTELATQAGFDDLLRFDGTRVEERRKDNLEFQAERDARRSDVDSDLRQA